MPCSVVAIFSMRLLGRQATLNEVAKYFGKKANEWLRLDSTIAYIDCLAEIQKRENPAFDENQLVVTKKGSPELALIKAFIITQKPTR